MKQRLLALDQLVNTFVYAKADRRCGYADETLSARCWRLRNSSKLWSTAHKIVDTIFFFDKNHCFESYKSEILHRQLPNEYYKDALAIYEQNFDKSPMSLDDFLRSIS